MMRIDLFKSLLILLSAALLLNGCATPKKPRIVRFEKTSFDQINGWEDDNHSWALDAYKNSCKKILSASSDKAISRLTQIGGTVRDWQQPCIEASLMADYSDDEAQSFFEKWFTPYKAADDDFNPKGLLTGYYQIELEGSKKKTNRYRYPVYRKPPNLSDVKGSSAIAHEQINRGALSGKGLEMAWVDNRARLYFMHIQGSGVLKLNDGSEMYLGFDDHNGYRFRGISEPLKERDLRLGSANSMMDWLHKNPKECQEIISQDPSYVFFKKQQIASAVGGQGVPLNPERSLAVDCGLYPYGAPVWVDAELPHNELYQGRKYKRLFVAQDTGGAIRGAVRGDVFFGRGYKAEKYAGGFKVPTHFFVLFPKTVAVPEKYTSK
jgi:membrane-bound lytic murein transglycosylase A